MGGHDQRATNERAYDLLQEIAEPHGYIERRTVVAGDQERLEAFDWLYVNGLLAHDVRRLGDEGEFFWITALGRRVLERVSGRRGVDAEAVLGLELHPVIDARVRRQFLAGEIEAAVLIAVREVEICLLYTSPSPRDRTRSRMPSSA